MQRGCVKSIYFWSSYMPLQWKPHKLKPLKNILHNFLASFERNIWNRFHNIDLLLLYSVWFVAISFRNPHQKNSRGVKSGNLGGLITSPNCFEEIHCFPSCVTSWSVLLQPHILQIILWDLCNQREVKSYDTFTPNSALKCLDGVKWSLMTETRVS